MVFWFSLITQQTVNVICDFVDIRFECWIRTPGEKKVDLVLKGVTPVIIIYIEKLHSTTAELLPHTQRQTHTQTNTSFKNHFFDPEAFAHALIPLISQDNTKKSDDWTVQMQILTRKKKRLVSPFPHAVSTNLPFLCAIDQLIKCQIKCTLSWLPACFPGVILSNGGKMLPIVYFSWLIWAGPLLFVTYLWLTD